MSENEVRIIIKMIGLNDARENGKYTCSKTRLFVAGWRANETLAKMAAKHRTQKADAAALLVELRNEVRLASGI